MFYSDTKNCGVDGKISPLTPQNVVSKVNFRRLLSHTIFCPGVLFVPLVVMTFKANDNDLEDVDCNVPQDPNTQELRAG